MTLAQLKEQPGAVWVDRRGTRYQKYAEALAEEVLRTAFFDGRPRAEGTAIFDKPKDQGGRRIGTVIRGRAVQGFMTPSGKVEFLARSLAGKHDAEGRPVNPLPAFEPRSWQPTPEYPLFLINWKEASHTHSRTQNNPWLLEIKGESPLVVHPATAARYGVADGGEVWVISRYGRARARVKVSRRIHPEVVGLQHGFGHWALGRMARGRGTSDSALRPARSDPLSGQALHKEACVRIEHA
jgi:thiosulfate reductase/polysulfide reductase chain A